MTEVEEAAYEYVMKKMDWRVFNNSINSFLAGLLSGGAFWLFAEWVVR
jgi:hypothetical protein